MRGRPDAQLRARDAVISRAKRIRPRSPRSLAGRSVALAVTFGAALSCQAAFGDYRIDESDVIISNVPCEPGESRCVGATLQTCAPDAEGFQTELTCESPALCNLETEGCTPCTPGKFQCNYGTLRRCKDDATWTDVKTCAARRLCDETQGACLERICEPGAYQCSSKKLQRCSSDGKSWEDVEDCGSPELCSADLANQQRANGEPAHCSPAVCEAGEYLCDDGRVRACNASLSAWAEPALPCDPKDRCNPKLGVCADCKPGDHACSGVTPFTCNAAGKWEKGADCLSPALCNATTGTCDSAACDSPGAFRCADIPTLLHCKTDLSAEENLDFCGSLVLCNTTEGRCEPAACRPGALRCQGSRLERCSDNLAGWELVQSCKREETCDSSGAGDCVGATCASGSARCNDRYLETCVHGKWERSARCLTKELCNAAELTCDPPMCVAGDYRCTGILKNVLDRCSAGRVYEFETTCPTGTQCDTGTCR